MKKLFLHAGAPKTGTSTIQNTLQRQSEKLDSIGVCYPTRFNDRFEYPHQRFISTGNANPMAYSMRFTGNPDEYRAFQADAVLRELGETIADADNVILSHEDLLFAPPDWLVRFRDWAVTRAFTVFPVIYVRDQVSWHISNYQQHVRQLMTDSSIYQVAGRSMVIPEWTRYTQKFIRVFGREQLITKLYRPQAGGNLVAEFMANLGFEGTAIGEMQRSDLNIGLSTQAAQLAANFHRHCRDRSQHRRLLELMKSSTVEPRGFIFPAAVHDLLTSYYEKSNEELCESCLSEEDAKALRSAMRLEQGRSSEDGAGTSLELAAEILSRLI